jgi:hypothetical protein
VYTQILICSPETDFQIREATVAGDLGRFSTFPVMDDWLLLVLGAAIMAFGIAIGTGISYAFRIRRDRLEQSKLEFPKQEPVFETLAENGQVQLNSEPLQPFPLPRTNLPSDGHVTVNMERTYQVNQVEVSINGSTSTLVSPAPLKGLMQDQRKHSLIGGVAVQEVIEKSVKFTPVKSSDNHRNSRYSIASFYTANDFSDDEIEEEGAPVADLNLSITEPIDQFKQRLLQKGKYDPKIHSDYFLYRFLRARKYDLDKSEEMILNYFAWREREKVDDIAENFVFQEAKKVSELYPQFYHKTDKEGRTIYIEQMKNLDFNKLMDITTVERLTKKHIREYEKFTQYRLVACSLKKGSNVENGLTIIDLKGVPLSQFNQVRKIIALLSTISSDYYPETMGKMFVINAPMLFTAVWSVVKQMLDEHTVSKIHILGSSYKSQLLDHIDPANLPKFYGGSCECPGGCEKSDLGPWNDGSVPGFPIARWESIKDRDGVNT